MLVYRPEWKIHSLQMANFLWILWICFCFIKVMVVFTKQKPWFLSSLGGGFKSFLFSSLPGEMIQFWRVFFRWVGSTTNQWTRHMVFIIHPPILVEIKSFGKWGKHSKHHRIEITSHKSLPKKNTTPKVGRFDGFFWPWLRPWPWPWWWHCGFDGFRFFQTVARWQGS